MQFQYATRFNLYRLTHEDNEYFSEILIYDEFASRRSYSHTTGHDQIEGPRRRMQLQIQIPTSDVPAVSFEGIV